MRSLDDARPFAGARDLPVVATEAIRPPPRLCAAEGPGGVLVALGVRKVRQARSRLGCLARRFLNS
jgi:hypothetical protein